MLRSMLIGLIRETPTVQDVLNGYAEDTTTKGDVMEVAINNMTLTNTSYQRFYSEDRKHSIVYPTCYIDYQQEFEGNTIAAKEKNSLRLIPEDSQFSIGLLLENRVKVDKRIEYSFSFISQDIHDSKNLFTIRNQRYVVKNIEIEVTAKGINPLQKGLFYRLDD